MKFNWTKVNWRKQDIDIAREFGYTRERVRQVRRKLGKPDPKTKHWSKRQHEVCRAVQALNGTIVTSRELKEIGIQTATARRYGAKVRNITQEERSLETQSRPYHLMNWKLPNADLEDIWHVRRQMKSGCHSQISQLRYERSLGKARWTRAGGKRPDDKMYWRALDAETAKAREWFGSHA